LWSEEKRKGSKLGGAFYKNKRDYNTTPFVYKKLTRQEEGKLEKFGWGDHLLKSNGGALMTHVFNNFVV